MNRPTSLYTKYTTVRGISGPSSYVLSSPYSIALSVVDVAKAMGVRIVSLVNNAGNVVSPGHFNQESAFRERTLTTTRTPQGKFVRTQAPDLLSPLGPNSWPWMQIASLAIPREFSRNSCRARSEVVKFIRWMMHSPVVATMLGELHGAVVLGDEMNVELGVEVQLLTLVHCASNQINSGDTDAITQGGGPVATTHPVDRRTLLTAYSVQQGRDYVFTNADELVVLEGTLDPVGNTDISWLFTSTFTELYPGILEGHLASGALTMFHISLSGVIPIFHLPPIASHRFAASSHQPFTIDMETLASIFLGEIRSWLDPRLSTHLTPGRLSNAFGSNGSGTAEDDAITVILCGIGQRSQATMFAIGNHFMLALKETNAWARAGLNFSMPIDWRGVLTRMEMNNVNFILVDDEIDLEVTMQRIPSSISYMLGWGNTTHLETEFQLVMPVELEPIKQPWCAKYGTCSGRSGIISCMC